MPPHGTSGLGGTRSQLSDPFAFSPWPHRNSIAASAVCVFNLSAVSQAFNGPFKYQESSRAAWLPYPNPNPNFQVISQAMGHSSVCSPEGTQSLMWSGQGSSNTGADAMQPGALGPLGACPVQPWSGRLVRLNRLRPFVASDAWGWTEKGQHSVAVWEPSLQLVLMMWILCPQKL